MSQTLFPVKLWRSAVIITAALSAIPCLAQQPKAVPVGKGSYADGPPFYEPKYAKFEPKYNRTPHVDPSLAGKPMPTNHWWTDLLMEGGDGGELWANPAVVQFDPQGVRVSYPVKWSEAKGPKEVGVELSTPLSIVPSAGMGGAEPQTVSPSSGFDTNVLKFGDWTVVARQQKSPQERWDVTFGHGLPFVWIECTGLKPSLKAGNGKHSRKEELKQPGNGTFEVLRLDGSSLGGGQTTDAFMVRINGQAYGVFGPQGMTVSVSGDGADISFGNNPKGWIAVGVLPDPKMAATLRTAAGAIPRDSIFTWKYDSSLGQVATTWELVTEALRSDETVPLQGWIPHHFHAAQFDMKPVGTPFLTPRGPLLLSQGNVAHINWTFPGVLPFYPEPKVISAEKNPYDPTRMSGYIAAVLAKRQKSPGNIGDTYWGGKMIQKTVQYAALAANTKDPLAKELHDDAKGYLADFFTYSGPGDKYFFARYPKWGALIGFPSAYGSEFFTDNHFHYGYFTTSAGILGAIDPDFIRDYGPMARLVAKQYGNWDRSDKDFPFLRTFDPWNGHSYAGGSSSKEGNNQESSSESMNAWGGLVLLGSAMGDSEMTACGAMGYSIESEAIRCYWNNYYGWKNGAAASVWPTNYQHAIIGILGDSGGGFRTFFSGAPQHVFGIEWLPDSPILCYLGLDPKFVRYQFDALMTDLSQAKKETTLEQIGDDWGSLVLGYLSYAEPATVAEKFDELWNSNSPIAHTSEETGIIYYMTHAGVQIGTIAWDWHTNVPTSTVFHTGNKVTAVIWNPESKPIQAQVMHGTTVAKTVPIQPRTLVTIPVQ